MKRVFMVLVLAIIVAGGVFSQEGPKNFIGGTVGLLDIGVHYERMLTPMFSVGGEAYWNSLIFWNTIGFKAFGRVYPWSRKFYVDVGLGYGIYIFFPLVSGDGFLIEPGVGWKIDFKKPGGFYIEPAVSVPLVMGKWSFRDRSHASDGITYYTKFAVGPNVRVRLGLGYAFKKSK